MNFLLCGLMLIFVSYDTLGFIVRGPSGPLIVPQGGSVILPCFVETHLAAEKLRVVWKKTDSEAVVHLYEDGESRAEKQHRDYHGRARFFTDQIQHGNFSLRLDNRTAGDKGFFRCKVYSQRVADQTLVEIKDVERLLVSGSSRSISASVGEDVTLNCSVDSHITPEHIEEVSWKKTDEVEDILVLLFQNNETLPDSAHERYRDRAEFFTAEISKGNFSLRLKSVRTEDKGVYMCQVFAGGLSANVTVVLVLLGFSELDITVLILCIFAPLFALLTCCFVYSKSGNQAKRLCLFLWPFIIMMLASIIWCIFQGSLYEATSCCMLYILGPLRLLWVAPLATDIPATILNYVKTAHTDHAAFTAMMYSVLLVEHFENISPVFRTASISLLVLVCLLFIIQLAEEKLLSCSGDFRIYKKCKLIVATCSFSWLPSLHLSLLLYSHSAPKEVFVITALPVIHWVSYLFCNGTKSVDQCCQRYQRILIRLMMIAMTGDMVFLYIILLTNKDGPICVAGFVQALSVMKFSEVPDYYKNVRMRKCLFLYGSAGLVLANSLVLMTEVIMKAVRGVRLLGDLRVVAFPSEWLFTVALLVSSLVASCKPVNTMSSQVQSGYNGTSGTKHSSIDLNQMTGESHESETLREVAGNSEEHQEEEIC